MQAEVLFVEIYLNIFFRLCLYNIFGDTALL